MDFDKLLEMSVDAEHKEMFNRLFRRNRIKDVIEELFDNPKCDIGFDVVGDDSSISTVITFKYPRSTVSE